ncbi:hypothetical protein [Chryseobacterium hagamense]|uniref:Uncharacterized protein n=1 Tax=Chryseobacterium hagamense TaxID=395935 RepID=A0A511YP74_9FLAO|nr:hypothetical protein [Chryseobacterium hagamense]GEN76988.1 hypothetical protein CHA01nite_27280 [Chryseobacterium hagamense]
MDKTVKYLHLKHDDKNAFQIVREMTDSLKTPLYAIRKIKELFPHLSLTEAKEIVIMTVTKYKNLYDYQDSLLPDLEEFSRILNED